MEKMRLVMGEVPVLARVKVRLVELPRGVSPKARLVGVICRWDWLPMPVSAAVRGRVEREVERLRVPGRVPVWVGVKVTLRAQVAEGARTPPGVGQVPVVV